MFRCLALPAVPGGIHTGCGCGTRTILTTLSSTCPSLAILTCTMRTSMDLVIIYKYIYIVKLPQFIVLVSLTVGPQLPSWQSLFSHGLTCQGGCLPFAPWPQLLVHLQRWAAVRIEPLVRKAAEALLLVAAVEARLLRIGSGACGLALGRKTWLRRASTW